MSETQTPTPRDCKHGQLARSCDVCELETDLAASRAEAKSAMNAYIEQVHDAIAERDAARAECARLKSIMAGSAESVKAALKTAYHLGQAYWQQADSDFASHNRRADVTRETFKKLVADTSAALSAPAEPKKEGAG